jgi:hypothetical protein
MNVAEFVVPTVLRDAMFVPGQAPGRREPARVAPGAFKAAGLPVPEHLAQRNVYQLTRRQGLPWTPGLDDHIRRRGGELLPHGRLILVDIDALAAVDGTPMVNALRWLADRAVEAGGLLDLSATVSVRTPGHPDSGHLPGWHLWYRADPAWPVHMGPAGALSCRRTSHPRHLPGLARVCGLGRAGPVAGPATVDRRPGRAAPHSGDEHRDRFWRRRCAVQAPRDHRAAAGRAARGTEPAVVLGQPAGG